MAAMQYAGLVGLLALTAATPRSPKPERRCPTAIPLTTASRRRWVVRRSKRSTAKAGELSARIGNGRAGVGGVLRRRQASVGNLVATIRSVAAGEGSLPPDMLARLLTQVGQLQRQVLAPRGLTFSGLTERELNVLRLLAEGLDTAEVSGQLFYSERTVKNIIHDITSRLELRNRTHAVAYAIKAGLI